MRGRCRKADIGDAEAQRQRPARLRRQLDDDRAAPSRGVGAGHRHCERADRGRLRGRAGVAGKGEGTSRGRGRAGREACAGHRGGAARAGRAGELHLVDVVGRIGGGEEGQRQGRGAGHVDVHRPGLAPGRRHIQGAERGATRALHEETQRAHGPRRCAIGDGEGGAEVPGCRRIQEEQRLAAGGPLDRRARGQRRARSMGPILTGACVAMVGEVGPTRRRHQWRAGHGPRERRCRCSAGDAGRVCRLGMAGRRREGEDDQEERAEPYREGAPVSHGHAKVSFLLVRAAGVPDRVPFTGAVAPSCAVAGAVPRQKPQEHPHVCPDVAE